MGRLHHARLSNSPAMDKHNNDASIPDMPEFATELKQKLLDAESRERALEEKITRLELERAQSVRSTPKGELASAKQATAKLTMDVELLQKQLEEEKESAATRERLAEEKTSRL